MNHIENDEEKNRILAQKAMDTLKACGNCAQATFAVLQEEFKLDGGPILKALTPFPGIALRGETCGAVTGALMALGMVYGRDRLDDWKGYIGSLPSARRFCRTFEEQYGGMTCETILQAKLGRKFNLADRAEAMDYAMSGGPQACAEVVACAVQIAADQIRKKESPRSNS